MLASPPPPATTPGSISSPDPRPEPLVVPPPAPTACGSRSSRTATSSPTPGSSIRSRLRSGRLAATRRNVASLAKYCAWFERSRDGPPPAATSVDAARTTSCAPSARAARSAVDAGDADWPRASVMLLTMSPVSTSPAETCRIPPSLAESASKPVAAKADAEPATVGVVATFGGARVGRSGRNVMVVLHGERAMRWVGGRCQRRSLPAAGR